LQKRREGGDSSDAHERFFIYYGVFAWTMRLVECKHFAYEEDSQRGSMFFGFCVDVVYGPLLRYILASTMNNFPVLNYC